MLSKKYMRSIIYIFILYFLLSNPQRIISAVKNSLLLCYENVIPSLFIFMVFANYVSQDTAFQILSVIFKPYARLMKVKDNEYPTYLLLSSIGGFAVGANLLSKMKAKGYDDKFLCVISITMVGNSLAFCVYSVGFGMMNNLYVGAMIYISILFAQLLTAFILSFFIDYDIQCCPNQKSGLPDFVNSLQQSVNSVITICGYVVVFYCVCDIISLYTNNKYILMVLSCFTEVTNGCIKVVNIFNNNYYFLCCALAIFPISTLMQVYNFTENSAILKTLLYSRIIVLPLALSILSILLNLFPQLAYTSVTTSIQIRSGQGSADLSLVLFMISLSFISICEKNKLFTKSKS